MDDKTILEGISLDNLTWSQEEFTLSDFVDKFPLPQIVKVEEGYYGPDEDSCLGADQILFLHALKHTEKVQARDVRKRELHIPLNCSQKVEIRPSNIKEAFESVAELARVFINKKIPQFVRVTQGYEDDNICVNPGDKLKLLKVVSEQSQEYLEVEFQDGSGLMLQIPFTALARFQPLTDGRDYYIQEAVTSTMPFFFQFIKPLNMSDTGEASVFNSTLGVLRAEKTYQDSTIVCTTKEGETRTVVTCPKQLQITITAANGALVGDKEYMKVCRFFHDGVSLKRIENMECFNVFASRDTIREYRYDVPQTPTTSLEEEFKSNDDDDDDDSHEYTYISDQEITKWTFHRFNYEEFKNSFDSEEADKDKLRNAEEGDNYEDIDEQPVNQKRSATPALYLEKPTPPPVKPKPVVKVQGTHHVETHNPEPTPKPRQTLLPTALTTATPLTTMAPPAPTPPPVTTIAPTVTPQVPTTATPPSAMTPTTTVTTTLNQEAKSKAKAADASVLTSSKAPSTTSNNLEKMTVGEVSQFLEKHRLAEFIETFEYNEVDGDMLVSMDLDMMEALGMNKFQQKKLSKLIQGWRPRC